MTDRVSLERGIGEVAARFAMRFQLSYAARRKRVAIFVSRYEHCLVDLLWRHRVGELPCEIALIVSNHPDLRGTAEHYGIPFEVFEITKQNKAAQEARETALLEQSRIDLLVLARYMQILSAGVHRALSRTGSSTSITPSCPPSRAASRITRPPSAA